MAHELAEDEDRRLHVEGHRVVLERRAVAVAHQVVDEAAVAGRRLGARGRRPRGSAPPAWTRGRRRARRNRMRSSGRARPSRRCGTRSRAGWARCHRSREPHYRRDAPVCYDLASYSWHPGSIQVQRDTLISCDLRERSHRPRPPPDGDGRRRRLPAVAAGPPASSHRPRGRPAAGAWAPMPSAKSRRSCSSAPSCARAARGSTGRSPRSPTTMKACVTSTST